MRNFYHSFKFWRRLQNALKTSWRCLEDVFTRRLEDVLRYMAKTNIGLDQGVFWRRKTKANIFVLIKTSFEDEDKRSLLKTKTKDVFIKKNVCWVISKLYFRFATNGTDLVKCSCWKRCFINQVKVPEWHILWFVFTHN